MGFMGAESKVVLEMATRRAGFFLLGLGEV
jgi:hypothetical protein